MSRHMPSPSRGSVVALTVLALFVAAPVAAQPASTAHDWPIYGRDFSNSVNAVSERTISPATVGDLVERWRLDGIAAVTGTPVVADGVVYFGDWAGRVSALDASAGSVIWQAAPSDAQITASAAVGGEVVVVSDLRGWVRALDRGSGEVRWATQLETPDASSFSSPVIIGDAVIIGFSGPDLGWGGRPGFHAGVAALDLADGQERWRLRSDAGTGDPDAWVPIWSSAGYDPDLGLIYIGTGNTDTLQDGQAGPHVDSSVDDPHANAIMAIDEANGQLAWITRLVEDDGGRDVDVGAAPNLFSVADRTVVGVGSKDGDYAVLDRGTGELLWRSHLTPGGDGGGVMSTAAVDTDTIFVASNGAGTMLRDGTIFALDMSDGSIRWQRAYSAAVMGGSMALADGVLFRGFTDGSLVALAASDGSELWSTTLGGMVNGGVSISDGIAYVGYGSGAPPDFAAVAGGLVAYGLR
jgi:polyvinyl alcohol dehydrogenase (cytochrome)